MHDKRLLIALIGAGAVIIAAVIGAFGPKFLRSDSKDDKPLVIAGTVVDSDSNRPIAQATVSISGRSDTYTTEDNGNFRLEIRGLSADDVVRLHVSKDGYRTYDHSVSPPLENFIVQLAR